MGRVFIRTACALLILYDAQNFIFLTLNGKSRIENILCSGKTYAFFFEDMIPGCSCKAKLFLSEIYQFRNKLYLLYWFS